MMFSKLLLAAKWRVDAHVVRCRKKLVFEGKIASHAAPQPHFVSFYTGSEDDLRKFAAMRAVGYDAESVRFCTERLRAGDELTIGIVDGQYAFSAWLMFGMLDLAVNDLITTRPDEVWGYKAFTVARFRGRGILAAFYEFQKPRLAQRGFRRILGAIDSHNSASIRAHQRASHVQIAHFYEFRLFHTKSRFVLCKDFKALVMKRS
jgi:hypothetical protein